MPGAEKGAFYFFGNMGYSGQVIITNAYDGLGRRVQKTIDDGVNTTYRQYLHNDKWQLIAEAPDITSDPLNDYLWHPYYIDALAVRWYDSDTDGDLGEAGDGAYYTIQDANFNVTAIVDATGAVKERYQYSL